MNREIPMRLMLGVALVLAYIAAVSWASYYVDSGHLVWLSVVMFGLGYLKRMQEEWKPVDTNSAD